MRAFPWILLGAALTEPCAAQTMLSDALAQAYKTSPVLEDARLGVRAARTQRTQAASAYLPNVMAFGALGERTAEAKTPTSLGAIYDERRLQPSTAAVEVTQALFTGGRRGAQMDFASASIDGAKSALRSTEQSVLLAAVEVYVAVRRDEDVLALRVAYLNGLERQVSGTQRRLDVGVVTRTDLAQAKARLAAARAGVSAAEAALSATRARYLEITGVPADDLALPPPAPAAPTSLDEAMVQAERKHPDLQQAKDAARAARAQIGLERSALLPQISLAARWSRAEDSDLAGDRLDDSSAYAQVSVPLFEGGLAWSKVHQSNLNLGRAEAQVEARRRAVLSEVSASWSASQASVDIVSAAQEETSAAEQAWRGAEREFGLGLRATIDVLNAELEWHEARIKQVRAEADAYVAAYRLQAAMGALAFEP